MAILYKSSVSKTTRKNRLIAHCIDLLTIMPITLITYILLFIYKNIAGYFFLSISALILGIYQSYLLTTLGQTIGKKVMKIRIVKKGTKTNGGFVINILLRSIVGSALLGAIIPYAIYSIVDLLFIFRNDKRCIHDIIAKTDVIDV